MYLISHLYQLLSTDSQLLTAADRREYRMLCKPLLTRRSRFQDRRKAASVLSSCDPPLIPPLLDLMILLLPSNDEELNQQVAAATEQESWKIGAQTLSVLQSAASAPGQPVGSHSLSAYDLSKLAVGVYRALLRVSPNCLPSPSLPHVLLHLFLCLVHCCLRCGRYRIDDES